MNEKIKALHMIYEYFYGSGIYALCGAGTSRILSTSFRKNDTRHPIQEYYEKGDQIPVTPWVVYQTCRYEIGKN
ncbi:hypothetical protein [Candidatus Spongiihabitans sp.]|uniref:hypothetical protein n=1 Tax=Candidatus Spongiihabitans sp. TaxID=3101308 RepID=UPI003C6F1D6B